MTICPTCKIDFKTEAGLRVHFKRKPEHQKAEEKAEEEKKLEEPEKKEVVKPVETGFEASVYKPAVDPNFLIPKNIKEELEIIEKISSSGNGTPVNVMVTGGQGNGKTSLALQFAAIYNRPAVVVDFGGLQEPQQLFLTVRLLEGEQGSYTDFRPSAFVEGVELPRCVVIQMPIPPKELLSELIVRKTGSPRSEAERIAKFVVKVTETLTEGSKISVRQALTIGEKIKHGDPFYRAVYYSIGRTHDKEWREQILQLLQMEILTPNEAEQLGKLVSQEEWEIWGGGR